MWQGTLALKPLPFFALGSDEVLQQKNIKIMLCRAAAAVGSFLCFVGGLLWGWKGPLLYS